MNHALRGLKLTICLILLSAGLTVAQSTSTETVPVTTAAPIANVYVGTTKGIYLYHTSAGGKPTLVAGSPFKTPAGLLIGVTGTHMITLGTHLVHSYLLSSTGTVVKAISSVDTVGFDSEQCGNIEQGTEFGSLNHQGKNVYIIFPILDGSCSATIQTYDISKTGVLTFNGSIDTGNNSGSGLLQPPAALANDKFLYAASDFECCGGIPGWSGYALSSTGEMLNWTFNLSPYNFLPTCCVPTYVTAGTGNYLAALVSYNDSEDNYAPLQLASYTVDNTTGDISTTATPTNMPYPSVTPCCFWIGNSLNMSPSGKLLAVAGINGLQVFHFNGAAPITAYSKALATDPIIGIRWDNDNHLFAVSNTTHKLYVFTVTPTTIVQVAGSPFTIPATPNTLIVVPK